MQCFSGSLVSSIGLLIVLTALPVIPFFALVRFKNVIGAVVNVIGLD